MKNAIAIACTFILGFAPLFTACDSQVTRIQDEEDFGKIEPLSITTNQGPPASSGLYVFRYGDLRGVRIFDWETGYMVQLGIDLFKLCSGETPVTPVSATIITQPEEFDRVLALFQGKEVHASLWNPTPYFSPTFCEDVLSQRGLVGTGTGRFVRTFNDYPGYRAPENNYTSTFGISASATLQPLGGDSLQVKDHIQVSARSRCTWTESIVRCRSKIVVSDL